MSEIKVIIDSYSEAQSLKDTNAELEKMLTHLREVSKIKGNKAKQAADTKAIAAETAELKKQQLQVEKLKAAIDKQAVAQQRLADQAAVSANKVLASEQRVEQQRIKTAQSALKLAEAEKKAADQAAKNAERAKRQNDAYGQLSRKHAELRREAMNLAAAYGLESKAAQEAAAKANNLDKQLKAIDARMGMHQRNVGNYASAWQGLNGVLGTLGISLSAGAVIGFLKTSVNEFMEAEKNAHALAFAVKNVADESEAMYDKLIDQSEELQASGGIFSDDEIQKAQTQLINYGLTTDAVEDLIPRILDLASAQGVDLATATDQVIKGINGQTKGLKMLGIDFKDTGSKAENYKLTIEGISKFQGAAQESTETYAGRMAVLENKFNDAQEAVGEFVLGLVDVVDWLFAGSDAADEYTGSLEDLRKEQERVNKLTSALDRQTLVDRYNALKQSGQDLNALEITKNQILEADRKKLAAETEKIDDATLDNQIKNLEESIKNQKYWMDAELDLTRQQKLEILKLEKANREALNNLGEDDEEGSGGRAKSELKKTSEAWKEEYKLSEQRKKDKEKKHIDELKQGKERNDQLLAEVEERRKANEEIKEAQEDLAHWQWQQEKEKNEKLAELRKQQQQEMLDEIEHVGDQVIQELQKRSEKELSIIRDKINEQEEMVDIQRQRAAQGLTNTLAFEERKKAELERAAIAEQKKQERLKKAEAYWTLLAKFAESDSDQAAEKAAREIVEGIAISAAFAEKGGMGEDLKDTTTLTEKGWSKTHGSGDVLTMISPKEGVLTEQNIAALGGKEGFYNLVYNLEKMGSNPINDDIFSQQNEAFMNVALMKAPVVDTSKLEQKVDKLTEVIENKPVPQFEIDSVGNIIYTILKKNSRIVTDKGSFIKPSRNRLIN